MCGYAPGSTSPPALPPPPSLSSNATANGPAAGGNATAVCPVSPVDFGTAASACASANATSFCSACAASLGAALCGAGVDLSLPGAADCLSTPNVLVSMLNSGVPLSQLSGSCGGAGGGAAALAGAFSANVTCAALGVAVGNGTSLLPPFYQASSAGSAMTLNLPLLAVAAGLAWLSLMARV